MKILTVGGGGREHAAVEALYKAGAEIYSVMKNKNPGIISRSKNYKILDERSIDEICEFAIENNVKFAFIGPEGPLEAGLVDALEFIEIKCAAPTKAAARIETSKLFMRELVKKYDIDGNLNFRVCHDVVSADIYLRSINHEVVIKPIGLTGGKGVKVQGEQLKNHKETMEYVREVLSSDAGKEGVLIEEKVTGEEFTQMVFVDGKHLAPMPIVQDHKRAYEGDQGPNTGGMGSYSDSNHLLPFLTEGNRDRALGILRRIISAMAEEGCPYHGPMYGQFMLTSSGPKIIEINARFGDPEAMNVLPIMETDFVSVIKEMVTGKIREEVKFKPLATVCKYVVPAGYGVESVSGQEICIDEARIKESGAEIFYANVELVDGKVMTGTSRSIGVVGIGETLEEANSRCERALMFIKGESINVRHDIGTKEMIDRKIALMKKLLP